MSQTAELCHDGGTGPLGFPLVALGHVVAPLVHSMPLVGQHLTPPRERDRKGSDVPSSGGLSSWSLAVPRALALGALGPLGGRPAFGLHLVQCPLLFPSVTVHRRDATGVCMLSLVCRFCLVSPFLPFPPSSVSSVARPGVRAAVFSLQDLGVTKVGHMKRILCGIKELSRSPPAAEA